MSTTTHAPHAALNPSFPSPTPTLAQVTAAIAALNTAETAALARTKGAVLTSNNARTALVTLLKQLRDYIQTTADADAENSAATGCMLPPDPCSSDLPSTAFSPPPARSASASGQQGVPAHTIFFPSGHVVAVPPSHETAQLPASQITSHDFALLQSTVHAPVHSIAHPPALLQSTVEPAPTTARHVPLSELQSRLQPAPQLAPHVAAELQSMLQLSRHAPMHDCVLLLQSMLHGAVVPQSTEHAEFWSHWQPVPLQLPEVVVAVELDEGGGGARTEEPPPPRIPVPDEPLQAATQEKTRRRGPQARERFTSRDHRVPRSEREGRVCDWLNRVKPAAANPGRHGDPRGTALARLP